MKHNQTQRIKALLLLSLMTLSTFAPAASLFQAWDTQDNKDLQPKLAKEKGEMLAIPFFQKGRKIQATGATLVAAVLGVVIATILQAGVNGFVGNATTRALPVSTATKIKDALIAAFSPSQLKQVGLWSLVKALKADPTRADAASFGQRVFEWMMDNKTFISTMACETVVGTILGVREYRRSSEWNARDKQRTALVETADLELDKATAILMDAIARQEAFEKLNTKAHQERGFTGKFSEREKLAAFFEAFTAAEATNLGLDHAKAKKADIEAARADDAALRPDAVRFGATATSTLPEVKAARDAHAALVTKLQAELNDALAQVTMSKAELDVLEAEIAKVNALTADAEIETAQLARLQEVLAAMKTKPAEVETVVADFATLNPRAKFLGATEAEAKTVNGLKTAQARHTAQAAALQADFEETTLATENLAKAELDAFAAALVALNATEADALTEAKIAELDAATVTRYRTALAAMKTKPDGHETTDRLLKTKQQQQQQQRAAVLLQSRARKWAAKNAFTKTKHNVKMAQAGVRGWLARRKLVQLKQTKAATLFESAYRRFQATKAYQTVQKAVKDAQRIVRGHNGRKLATAAKLQKMGPLALTAPLTEAELEALAQAELIEIERLAAEKGVFSEAVLADLAAKDEAALIALGDQRGAYEALFTRDIDGNVNALELAQTTPLLEALARMDGATKTAEMKFIEGLVKAKHASLQPVPPAGNDAEQERLAAELEADATTLATYRAQIAGYSAEELAEFIARFGDHNNDAVTQAKQLAAARQVEIAREAEDVLRQERERQEREAQEALLRQQREEQAAALLEAQQKTAAKEAFSARIKDLKSDAEITAAREQLATLGGDVDLGRALDAQAQVIEETALRLAREAEARLRQQREREAEEAKAQRAAKFKSDCDEALRTGKHGDKLDLIDEDGNPVILYVDRSKATAGLNPEKSKAPAYVAPKPTPPAPRASSPVRTPKTITEVEFDKDGWKEIKFVATLGAGAGFPKKGTHKPFDFIKKGDKVFQLDKAGNFWTEIGSRHVRTKTVAA